MSILLKVWCKKLSDFRNFSTFKISAFTLKKPLNDNIQFGDIITGEIPRQPISMDEELIPPIPIAIIEDYTELDEPIIEFRSGKNTTLGLTTKLEGSTWILIVTKQQDYEQISMRAYRIQISIGDETVTILLNVNNIFDNPPMITANTMPCIVEVRLRFFLSPIHHHINKFFSYFSFQELKENFATNCSFVSFIRYWILCFLPKQMIDEILSLEPCKSNNLPFLTNFMKKDLIYGIWE